MKETLFHYKFIDIHCHILPDIDDGSKDVQMSLAMARKAEQDNTGTIIVTPHNSIAYPCAKPDEIRNALAKLQHIFTNEGIEIKLYPGNELLYDQTLPERLLKKEALCLADTEYCLVEFHPQVDYNYISNGLQALIYQGFFPVLAHCERYECLVREPLKAERLARQGVLLQVNAESVSKHLFHRMPTLVNELIKKNLISFVATDAHRDSGSRVPDLLCAADFLQKKLDRNQVCNLLRRNAERMMNTKL